MKYEKDNAFKMHCAFKKKNKIIYYITNDIQFYKLCIWFDCTTVKY